MILFANGVLVFECSCSAMSIRLLIKIKETAYLVEAARLMYSRGCVKVKSRPGHDRAHETLSSPPPPPPLPLHPTPSCRLAIFGYRSNAITTLRLPRLRAAAIAHFCLALSLILCSFALDLSSPSPPPPVVRSLSPSKETRALRRVFRKCTVDRIHGEREVVRSRSMDGSWRQYRHDNTSLAWNIYELDLMKFGSRIIWVSNVETFLFN